MKEIILDGIFTERRTGSLSADGTFKEGIHLITGEVGSGKSTLALLLLIAGFLAPSSGKIRSTGISSQIVSFQFPEYHLKGLTLVDECKSWRLESGPVLESADLSAKGAEPPLSPCRGELKRLHLVCVLTKKYDRLVLDEPLSSLDWKEKSRFYRLLERHRGHRAGICIMNRHRLYPRTDDPPESGPYLGDHRWQTVQQRTTAGCNFPLVHRSTSDKIPDGEG